MAIVVLNLCFFMRFSTTIATFGYNHAINSSLSYTGLTSLTSHSQLFVFQPITLAFGGFRALC